jgi:hypothetical protein
MQISASGAISRARAGQGFAWSINRSPVRIVRPRLRQPCGSPGSVARSAKGSTSSAAGGKGCTHERGADVYCGRSFRNGGWGSLTVRAVCGSAGTRGMSNSYTTYADYTGYVWPCDGCGIKCRSANGLCDACATKTRKCMECRKEFETKRDDRFCIDCRGKLRLEIAGDDYIYF